MNGGRFDFDDGGTYCGGWEDGKAHGHGVCTGPKGQGEYAGAWHYGFEVSGVYMWPSGNTYSGQWQNGKRHGLGIEQRGRWLYRGEWTQGYKGRYGIRQSTNSHARYEGTWSSGLQDGYGTETYADGGTYQGQWLRGMRHGYGVRKSAAYGVAAKFRTRSHAHASLTSLRSEQGAADDDLQDKDSKPGEESRGGFVLRAHSEPPHRRRRSLSERTLHLKQNILSGLRIKKQKSTGDIHARVTAGETPRSVRSSGSTMSCTSDESGYDHRGHGGADDGLLPAEEHVDVNTVETYMGEWKNDKRSGFGVSERSDGLKYEGEWYNNKKFGYGVTTLKDGFREEGKYKNNILVTSQRKKQLLFVRSSKLRERIDAATAAANRAAQIALQKADIAISRMATARDRGEQADLSSDQSRADSDLARIHAKQFDPSFHQPGTDIMKRGRYETTANHVAFGLGGSGAPPAPDPMALHQPLTVNTPAVPAMMRPQGMRLPHQDSLGYDAAMLAGATPSGSGPPSQEPMHTPFNTPPTEYRNVDPLEQDLPPQTVSVPKMENMNGPAVISPVVGLPYSAPTEVPNAIEHQAVVEPVPITPTNETGPEALAMMSASQMYDSMASTSSAPAPKQPSPPRELPNKTPVSDNARPPVRYAANVSTTRQYTPAEDEYSRTSGNGGGSASVASSRTSLNLWNDHFDQYVHVSNPAAAKPMPSRAQPSRAMQPSAEQSTSGAPSGAIHRRTTLGSSRDWKNPALAAKSPALQTVDDTATTSSHHAGSNAVPHALPATMKLNTAAAPAPGALTKSEEKGSLPDVRQLNTIFSREEASRMSSQRRQELMRMHDEEELLRTNPLRYLFHPAVREWVIRWKLPLLVVLVNLCLSIMFYQLLTLADDDDVDD